MSHSTVVRVFFAVIFLGMILSFGAMATEDTNVTVKDFQTVLRTVRFIEPLPSPGAMMAIVYDPNNGGSVASAQAMDRLIHSSKGELSSKLVSVDQMGALQGVPFVFVAGKLSQHYGQLKSIFTRQKIVGFSLDRACVEQAACAVYINSKGRVEIVINQSVTTSIGAKFKSVFLMMVTVI